MFKYNNLSIILRIFILLPFLFQTVLCDTLDAEKLDNSEAIFNLGLSYYNGKGFEQNYAKAVEYFEKAEKLGNTKAMLQLSNCYLFGFGVVKNLTKSVEYYEKASNLHDTEKTSAYYFASAYHQNGNDMDYIGDCYYFGINGYERNYEKAFEYFQKAAKLNNSHSINLLAESFYEGIGVVKNVTKAYEYYKQSAELNDTFAIYKLGVAYYLGTEIEQNNTKSYEYFLRGSELNNSDSCVYLGTFYMDDRIGKKNLAKAIECFSKSVFIERAFSYQTLGNMYWSSIDYHDAGVFKSIEGLLSVFSNSFGCNFHTKINEQISKKFEYYDKSIQFDDPNCCIFLIKYFVKNNEFKKAIDYLEIAAKSNNAKAIMLLGVFYYDGIGVDVNYKKAIEYFEKAEKFGDSDAIINIGSCYFFGEGSRLDRSKAIEYFNKAAALGNVRALRHLVSSYLSDFKQSNMAVIFEYNEKAINSGYNGGLFGFLLYILTYTIRQLNI